VNTILSQQWAYRKRRLERRLDKTDVRGCHQPMLTARNIHYEVAGRTRGLAWGGLGAMHLLARRYGLIDGINQGLHLLKIHLPYHESDHVLALAYVPLCGGTCLEDLEWMRTDEVLLDALGARRIPDPTTAGDFCRRFTAADIGRLQDIFHDTRCRVWAEQPPEFLDRAMIDVDGHLVETTGECKEGMDIAYDGTWGYHPLVVTLANTGEVLWLGNRSGNRPSHEGAAAVIDRCLEVCFRGGFRKVLVRGDTDFSQTEHLDRWNADERVHFLFGFDAVPTLQNLAEDLPERVWQPLVRRPRYTVKTQPRSRPDKVKDRIVREREYETLRLRSEQVADWHYRPAACRETYRLIIVRKNISKEKGEIRLVDEIRYFFYLTNDWLTEPDELVFLANDRCQQENLIEQLKNGVRALRAPVDNLESNWAYMVMTALAWNLKAWWALTLPENAGRWYEHHQAQKTWVLKLEFKKFLKAFVHLPCQIIRQARRLIYRLGSWNPFQPIFFRLVTALRH